MREITMCLTDEGVLLYYYLQLVEAKLIEAYVFWKKKEMV